MAFTLQKPICGITCILMLTFLAADCTFIQLREEAKLAQNSIVLVGNVSSNLSFRDMPVVVAAYSKKDSHRTIVHYTALHELGPIDRSPDGIWPNDRPGTAVAARRQACTPSEAPASES